MGILALAVALAAVASLSGDEPAEPMCVEGGANSAIWLLQSPLVRSELVMTDEQRTRIDRLYHDFQRGLRGIPGTLTIPPEELEKLRAAKIERERQRTVDYSRKAARILDESQTKRLDQIFVQYLGEFALLNPKVAEHLDMTEDQKRELVELANERHDTIERSGATEELLARFRSAMLNVLTDAQKAKWDAAVGKKFAVPSPKLIGSPGRS